VRLLRRGTGLEKILSIVPADVKVIPGPGPLSTTTDVRKFIAMLKDTRNLVQQGLKEGKTMDQLKSGNIFEKYSDLSKGMIKSDKWIDTLNADLNPEPLSKAP
jgi:hypothetical protein